MLSQLPDDETGYTREKVAEGLKQVEELDPGTSSKHIMLALRHAITGRKIGPGMAETIAVLGKKRTLERIKAALG